MCISRDGRVQEWTCHGVKPSSAYSAITCQIRPLPGRMQLRRTSTQGTRCSQQQDLNIVATKPLQRANTLCNQYTTSNELTCNDLVHPKRTGACVCECKHCGMSTSQSVSVAENDTVHGKKLGEGALATTTSMEPVRLLSSTRSMLHSKQFSLLSKRHSPSQDFTVGAECTPAHLHAALSQAEVC